MTLPYLDPLPNETSKAYDAFAIYRDLGTGRSVAAAYGKSTGRVGKANKVWDDWSSKYQWIERAKLYDAYLANIRRQEIEALHTAELEKYRDELTKTSKAALQAGQRMLQLALKRLVEMDKTGEAVAAKSLPAFVKAANDTITSAMDGWGMALTVDELMTLLENMDNDNEV